MDPSTRKQISQPVNVGRRIYIMLHGQTVKRFSQTAANNRHALWKRVFREKLPEGLASIHVVTGLADATFRKIRLASWPGVAPAFHGVNDYFSASLAAGEGFAADARAISRFILQCRDLRLGIASVKADPFFCGVFQRENHPVRAVWAHGPTLDGD